MENIYLQDDTASALKWWDSFTLDKCRELATEYKVTLPAEDSEVLEMWRAETGNINE